MHVIAEVYFQNLDASQFCAVKCLAVDIVRKRVSLVFANLPWCKYSIMANFELEYGS